MDGHIREEFRNSMDQFDFLNVFFDAQNRRFLKVLKKSTLTKQEIVAFTSDNGFAHKTPDRGLILQINDVRVYQICKKWVVCYRHRPVAVRTDYQTIDKSCVVVYSDISKEVLQDLPYHTSYDGNMPCWRY